MACKVKVNRHGYLAFRLYWNGLESWEGTGWKDTPQNRERAEARRVVISEEIKKGTFDYLKWFPDGNKAHEFKPPVGGALTPRKPLTIREFYDDWIEKKKPPFVRVSLERNYRQDFQSYILPFMGEMELNSVNVDTLESFRVQLVNEWRLALKTVRNIIDGSLSSHASRRGPPY